MALLPKNEKTEKDITPKFFFIWGQSMHGKTYLAKHFPDPLILNTDGNGKKIDTPHLDIYDFETFVKALKEIEEGKHEFKTIVVDLVDDIKTFMDEYIIQKYNEENVAKGLRAEALSDIPFGRGFSTSKATWKRLMIRLSQLKYNVIVISHIIQVTDEYDKSTTIDQPSLEQKYLNMTKGRTDVMIRCQKIGKTYLQICNEKRDRYKTTDFKDKEILKTLENVKQLFEDKKPVIQNLQKKETKNETKNEVKNETKTETKIEEIVVPIKKEQKEIKTEKKSLLIKKEEE